MIITRTIKITMSQEEEKALNTVMNSLEEFCTQMRSFKEIDEDENFIFDCAAKALSYLDDFRVSI